MKKLIFVFMTSVLFSSIAHGSEELTKSIKELDEFIVDLKKDKKEIQQKIIGCYGREYSQYQYDFSQIGDILYDMEQLKIYLLQQQVHEDLKGHFYQLFNLKRTILR